jgi:hypothetical protein
MSQHSGRKVNSWSLAKPAFFCTGALMLLAERRCLRDLAPPRPSFDSTVKRSYVGPFAIMAKS